MTTTRPIGERIRSICALIDKIGPSGGAQLNAHFPDIEPSNVAKYCSRAVGLGLMTRTPGRGSRSSYSVFELTPNWREILDVRKTTRRNKPMIEAVKPRKRSKWQGVSSVFNMGAI